MEKIESFQLTEIRFLGILINQLTLSIAPGAIHVSFLMQSDFLFNIY